MDKKVVKLAVIRDHEDNSCPFGLDIPFGCKSAGDTIDKMAPLSILGEEADDEEIKMISDANKKLLLLQGSGQRCLYAGKVFTEQKSVECNFDSHAPGLDSNTFVPSSFYSRVYDNVAYDGLYSVPLGWFGESNTSRNLYYGAYSLTSSDSRKKINKKAYIESDIKDAIQNVQKINNDNYTGKLCYKIAYKGGMDIDSIISWVSGSFSNHWNSGQLNELSGDELFEEIAKFRGSDWAEKAISWIEGDFTPLILCYTDKGSFLGDGNGRLSLAIGLGINTLPVIVINEDERGDICFSVESGFVR